MAIMEIGVLCNGYFYIGIILKFPYSKSKLAKMFI